MRVHTLRPSFRASARLLFVLGTSAAFVAAQGPAPNVVFLFADDLGWTDLSTGATNLGNGSDYYRTPHIDALARSGMSFTSAYTNGPNCAPTRAALMSGQWAQRTGVYTVNSSNRGLAQYRLLDGAPNSTVVDGSVVTLAETLRTASYATGHFGKWHLGSDGFGTGPTPQGFDHNVGGTSSGSVSGGSSGHFAHADGSWNLPNLPANGNANQFMAERLTDEALAWMTANRSSPFFCYLTDFSVHTPIQAPATDVAAFNGVPPGVRHRNQTYAGMLKNLDDQVGRVVAFLENTPDPRNPGQELIDNTVVVFYSDNGGLGGYASAGVSGGSEVTHQFPLKSGKGSLYKGGIRVPLVVRWDGVVPAGSTNATAVQTIDFYPTLASVTGASLPSGQVVDGVDFSPILRGQASGLPRPSVFWHFPAYLQASSSQGTWRATPVSVVRNGDFKLHFEYETRTWELYDLAADIGEANDLAATQPGVVRSMGLELRRWLERTQAELPRIKGTNQQVPLPDPPGGGGDAVSWQQSIPSAAPAARSGHVLASGAGGVWLFGGAAANGVGAGLWWFDGADWARRTPDVSPPARARHAAAWDGTSARVIVFGGEDASGALLGDTWSFDGVGWSRGGGASSPPPRRDHDVAFDAVRDRLVLFGGRDASGALGDTWEFDGSGWAMRTSASAPAARWGHGMAFDVAGARTVLFGGVDGAGNILADSWAWDGGGWVALAPTAAPPARAEFAIAHDPIRGRTVVWGGRDAAVVRDDTWELDGRDWVRRDPLSAPAAATDAALAFAPGLDRAVLFGGSARSSLSNATWTYQADPLAHAGSFGAGCAGSGGTPQLEARSRPFLGESFDVALTGLPLAPTNVFLLTGFSRTAWPGGTLPFSLGSLGAPACDLHVDPVVAAPTVALGGGTVVTLRIPTDPGLAGGAFFVQGFVFDPPANPLQLVTSNGVEATIGGR